MKPEARRDGILVRGAGAEIVLQHIGTGESHRLDRPTALVWMHCDGKTDVAGLAVLLGQELGAPPDEALVRSALRTLSEANLLKAPFE